MCAPAWPRCSPVLVLIGFTAVIAQVVLMRELMVVFNGNEISLGLMLAGWLLWTAFGSGVLGRAAGQVALLEIFVAIAFPATILAVRCARQVFHALPGELLGPVPMLLASFCAFSLFCAASGWLFAAGSRLYAQETGSVTSTATGAVYLLEAAGSGLGGILASLVLIRYLDPFEIAALVAALNLIAAASLLGRRSALPALAAALALFLTAPLLSRLGSARLWSGFRLLAARNSIYGNLAVVSTGGATSLFENGLNVVNIPDVAAAEEAVHYALLEHPSPRNVLLIGEGINGSVPEALRHPTVRQLDYVELDPAILDLARGYFPEQWAGLGDPRVHVHYADGRLYLKTSTGGFDVVIVNLPDPQTAQLNRFYTLEFFREAARKLAPGGILSLRLTASETYISPELAAFLRCIHKTLRAVFPEVLAIPGETVHFFAASRPGILTASAGELVERLRARKLSTVYVREYYLPFRLMPDRVADLNAQIRPDAGTVNRDFAPIAYYFDTVLWSARFGGWKLGVAPVVVLAFLFLVFLGRSGICPTGVCVAVMGFTTIGLEMLLLLAFQAIYGYVYHQLAIVIAGFMAGMALGSWLGMRRTVSLAGLQLVAAVAPLAVYGVFETLARVPAVAPVLFPALALLCGALGGWQFPVASRIFFASAGRGGPGTLYALDLAGSCLGAVLFSAYLVPVLGFLRTALVVAAVNLLPAGLAIARRKPAL